MFCRIISADRSACAHAGADAATVIKNSSNSLFDIVPILHARALRFVSRIIMASHKPALTPNIGSYSGQLRVKHIGALPWYPHAEPGGGAMFPNSVLPAPRAIFRRKMQTRA